MIDPLDRLVDSRSLREGGDQPPSLTSSEDIEKADDLVTKFSWPEESRVSDSR